jgi:hypothetical protein
MSHIKRFLRWFFYDFEAYYALPVLIALAFVLVTVLKLTMP